MNTNSKTFSVPVTVTEKIHATYEALSAKGLLNQRPAQTALSQDIAGALLSRHTLVAEAPTGTGKTLAYLIGLLGPVTSIPTVVATATKSLQHQLLDNDIPKLLETGVIQPQEVRVLKGKSNYVCKRTLLQTIDRLEEGGEELELEDNSVVHMSLPVLASMAAALATNSWDGDFDNYAGALPLKTHPLGVNSETCTRKQCEHFKECPYYRKREEACSARVLVLNHDLVLRDLDQRQQGLEGVIPVDEYRIVFDEAHHLPDKAIQVGTKEASLSALKSNLPKVLGLKKIVEMTPALKLRAVAQNVDLSLLNVDNLKSCLQVLSGLLEDIPVQEETRQFRFKQGQLPEDVRTELDRAAQEARRLFSALAGVHTVLMAEKPEGLSQRKIVFEGLQRAAQLKGQLSSFTQFADASASPAARACWLYRHGDSLSLHLAPLEGAQVLQSLLWEATEHVRSVVMVSATLRDLGGFSRFKARAGLPDTTQFRVLPYTFPYQESQLVVPAMRATPKQSERGDYLKELTRKLPEIVNAREGTLILCSSWSMLKTVVPVLREHLGDKVIRAQGDIALKQMVKEHCAAIDAGEGSVLCGVAGMAEGLDLPGNYCTHVVICAIPFLAPTDPVEEEIAEQLGAQYFGARALPDASMRLTQMVGRLLRRESDRGRVTILDRRLVNTSYGMKLLKALPPFKRVVEPVNA